MSLLTIHINSRPYQLACDPGEEAHVSELAQQFNKYVTSLAGQVGQAPDNILFLMAALTMGDTIAEQEREIELLQRQNEQLQKEASLRKVSKKANDAGTRDLLDNIAERIDQLAGELAES